MIYYILQEKKEKDEAIKEVRKCVPRKDRQLTVR